MLSRCCVSTIALAALLTTSGLGVTMASAADEPENIVKYRKNVMRAQAAHMGMIAAALKGEVSWTDEIAGHAHALSEMSGGLERLFPEGTGRDDGLDSKALIVIWEGPDDFAAQLQTYQEATAALAEAAESGDMAAIGAAVGQVGKDGCGSCHDTYRAEN